VVPRVEKHVAQRISDLAWSPQNAHVVAGREQRALSSEAGIDPSSEANREPLHPGAKRILPRGFGDQVQRCR
jgi:hypothetical protein